MMVSKLLTLLSVINLIPFFCFSQKNNEQVISSNSIEFTISVPDNYSQTHSNIYLKRTKDPNEHYGLLLKVFENSNKSIAIGFVGGPIMSSKKNVIDSIRANNSHLATIAHEEDNSKFKTKLLSKRYLKGTNADKAYIYQLDLRNSFLDNYPECKAILLHNENIADAQVFYFYNDKSKEEINKLIKNTIGILKFRN